MKGTFSGPKYEWIKEIPLHLIQRRHEYGGIYTYHFVPSEPVPYTPSQYAHLRVALSDHAEKQVREFSIASAPHEPHIQFTIDGKSKSAFQTALQELEIGGEVRLFKTNSYMPWPVIEKELVFIAGGIGITPFRSMCLDWKNRNLTSRLSLIHVAREYFLFQNELQDLVTEYIQAQRDSLTGTLESVVQKSPHARYYVAGSVSFVESVSETLRSHGVERIESDCFDGYVE